MPLFHFTEESGRYIHAAMIRCRISKHAVSHMFWYKRECAGSNGGKLALGQIASRTIVCVTRPTSRWPLSTCCFNISLSHCMRARDEMASAFSAAREVSCASAALKINTSQLDSSWAFLIVWCQDLRSKSAMTAQATRHLEGNKYIRELATKPV